MEQNSPNDNLASGSADASDAVADSLETLLALGLPKDSKLTDQIRPLARDLLIELDPQDTAERMLVVQMIAAFSRSMFLSRYANLQKNPKWFALYSGECGRAMTLFRRQMQTFNDMRRPRRTTFTAIRQANIAGQKIVVNDPQIQPHPSNPGPQPTTYNTQPTTPDAQPLQKTQAALPPQPSRPRDPAKKRAKKPPLAT